MRLLLSVILLFSFSSGWWRGTAAAGEDADRLYRQVVQDMEQAQREVAECEQRVRAQERVVTPLLAACQEAAKKLEEAARKRRVAEARHETVKNIEETRLGDLKDKVEAMEAEIEHWEAEARRTDVPDLKKTWTENAERLKLQLIIVKNELEMARKALAKELKASGLGLGEADQEKALREAERAADAYWEARHAAAKPYLAWRDQDILLGARQKSLQEARDRLAVLEDEAPDKLVAAAPPYLTEVAAQGPDGKTFYEARWVDEEELVDLELEVCAALIESQAASLGRWQSVRDQLVEDLLEADRDYQDKIRWYEAEVRREARWRIVIELADSAVSIFWDEKGNWEFNLFFEAVTRVGAAVAGYGADQYQFPKIEDPASVSLPGALAPEATKTTTKECLQAVLKRWARDLAGEIPKDLARTAAKRAAREALRPRIETLADEATAEALYDRVFRRPVSKVEKSDVVKLLRELKDVGKYRGFGQELKKKILSRDFAKELGKSLVQAALKEAALKKAMEGREQAFYELYASGLFLDYVRKAVEQGYQATRSEKQKLEWLNEIRRDLLARRDEAECRRQLVPRAWETCERSEGQVRLRLTFTRPVKVLSLRLGGRDLPAPAAGGETAEVNVEIKGLPRCSRLRVEAEDAYARKRLDSLPETAGRFAPTQRRWTGYEAGADEQHELCFGPPPDRRAVSLVLLFDCSGSMNEGGKLAAAKSAARSLLDQPGMLGEHDEVAVWKFFGNRPSLVLAFTRSREQVREAIGRLQADGGTPLGQSIRLAGSYLVNQAHYQKKVLVVLSDGLETAGDNPKLAIESIRQLAARRSSQAEVRKEGW